MLIQGIFRLSPVDVLEREINPGRLSHGQDVKNGICGASHGDIQGHGVLKRGFAGDGARQDRIIVFLVIAIGQLDDQVGRSVEQSGSFNMGGQDRSVSRKAESQGFHQTVHGIGRKHSAAGTACGAGRVFDTFQVIIRYGIVACHDHGVDQVQIFVVHFSGFHGPAGDENGGDVQPHGGHQHSRRDFIAVGDADQGVGAVGVHHVFDAVGDDFPGRQGVEHAVVSHGDAVVDGDGVEFGRETAVLFNALFDLLANIMKVNMTRYELREGGWRRR